MDDRVRRLMKQLELIAKVNPPAHARIMQLVDRLYDDEISEAEFETELEAVHRIKPSDGTH